MWWAVAVILAGAAAAVVLTGASPGTKRGIPAAAGRGVVTETVNVTAIPSVLPFPAPGWAPATDTPEHDHADGASRGRSVHDQQGKHDAPRGRVGDQTGAGDRGEPLGVGGEAPTRTHNRVVTGAVLAGRNLARLLGRRPA